MVDEIKELAMKFKKRLSEETKSTSLSEHKFDDSNDDNHTKAYEDFKKQYLPKHLSLYESACKLAEKIMPIAPDKNKVKPLEKAIENCHLNISPTGVSSLAILAPLTLIMTSLILFFFIPFLLGAEPVLFFVIFSLLVGVGIMVPLQQLPFYFSNKWRMQASNQMVLSVFYMVTFMRHTSNLENAINFAAEHLTPPLSLDLKKVIWDVETEKFDSLKESLDSYLESWKDTNMEYIESVHLVEGSLFESTEIRRIGSLEKSLTVILDETFEKMLHYAHNLQGPLTTLNMLGVVLPILGLVILPLAVSFMGGFKWYHLFALYNITLPALVYLLGKKILATRPGGYGDTDITEKNPELKKYKNIIIKLGSNEIELSPKFFATMLFFILMVGGFIPLILFYTPGFSDYVIADLGEGLVLTTLDYVTFPVEQVRYYFIGIRDERIDGVLTGDFIGPFGLGATLFSLLIPLGIGLSLGFYYKWKTKNIISIRTQSKNLELEFSSALFQLGNRLGDGMPAEIAFSKVAEVMQGSLSGKFFEIVSVNITQLGMNVNDAIFDPKRGAIKYYPSDIIESSMKVLVESSRKGPLIASQAVINVSEYIKEMHRVDERLKDLLGEIIGSMKSQISFLTPVIAAIVMGITSMITKILGTLGERMAQIGSQAGTAAGGAGAVMAMFGSGIPTYYFQAIVGTYVVQIVLILTIISNGIENGVDKLNEEYSLGTNLIRSTLLYVGLAFGVILAFNLIAGGIIAGLAK